MEALVPISGPIMLVEDGGSGQSSVWDWIAEFMSQVRDRVPF